MPTTPLSSPQLIPSPAAEALPPQQRQHLETLIADYTQRTQRSKTWAQTYRPVLADQRAVSGFHLLTKEMAYPLVAERSQGAYIWDIDDNQYIDVTMGMGVNLFGHNPPFIKAALTEQLDRGMQIGPQTELAGAVATAITQLTGLERVAFSNTGTEAVMTAIRLARTATGRSKIALFAGSYHGHFDGTLAQSHTVDGQPRTVAVAPGIPASMIQDVLVLDYGSPQALEQIQAQASELAAVLVVPVQTFRPNLQPVDFLRDLRQLTRNEDIALIFDEMITGFRIHPGGAQAWFGVQADLATYGKIIGGGLPIGAIAGQARYLDHIDGGSWNYGDASSPTVQPTFFAGTFCKHPLAMAAAHAVLQRLLAEGATLQDRLNQQTTEFVQQLNTYFEAEAVPIRMACFGSLFGPIATEAPRFFSGSLTTAQPDLLYYHLLHRGILLRGGGGFLSTAHTEADLQHIFAAVQQSIAALRAGGFLG
ncbi:MAG: aminotransferase class III-fold pyridoxal phosphate-dependent enzyme [Tildeniella torsiva UHER 1998/13D]|jgi:glutamate-1-semialdehyde aminotransferase|nr:aminotransferase class III-fold pyridoxal phosphate-dependent enzyme [Tildeniella torsiva UHER 1998/13D]